MFAAASFPLKKESIGLTLRQQSEWAQQPPACSLSHLATSRSHVPCRLRSSSGCCTPSPQPSGHHDFSPQPQCGTVNHAMSSGRRLSNSGQPSDSFSQVKPVTDAFSVRQLLYVFLLQGVGAAAVCFGINFGVAVLVFRGQPPPILFEFPIPLAGNFGVIIAVEVLLNYIISGSLQTLDVLKGVCPPIKPSALGPLWPKRDSPLQ